MLQIFQDCGFLLWGLGYQITLLEGMAHKSIEKKTKWVFLIVERVEIMESFGYLCKTVPWNLVC